MPTAEFVYVTYIRSTRERVWQALTDNAFIAQYWSNHHNVSDWEVGSPWTHQDASDPSIVDIAGTVLERDHPRRLVYTFASPRDIGNDDKTSRVAFDIAQSGELVRLTVTHDRLEEGSSMHKGISGGWPQILASLKSLLETGSALPQISTRGVGKWVSVEFT